MCTQCCHITGRSWMTLFLPRTLGTSLSVEWFSRSLHLEGKLVLRPLKRSFYRNRQRCVRKVARIFQGSLGRGDEQQQEQNSPNLGPTCYPTSPAASAAFIPTQTTTTTNYICSSLQLRALTAKRRRCEERPSLPPPPLMPSIHLPLRRRTRRVKCTVALQTVMGLFCSRG